MALWQIQDETNTPLDADATYTGDSVMVKNYVQGGDYITGSCYADQDGTLKVQFSSDGTNWDIEDSKPYTASDKMGFRIRILDKYARVVFENGSTAQSTFRLHWRIDDQQ